MVLVCSSHIDVVRDQYILIDFYFGILPKLSWYTALDPAHIAISTLISGDWAVVFAIAVVVFASLFYFQ